MFCVKFTVEFLTVSKVQFCIAQFLFLLQSRGHWPRKRVWGCATLKTPFHASLVVRKGTISSKNNLNSVNYKTPFEKKIEILASTASIFAQIKISSPIVENFCSQDPSFRGKNKFASPTLQKPGPHTPASEKVECPLSVTIGEMFDLLSIVISKFHKLPYVMPLQTPHYL